MRRMVIQLGLHLEQMNSQLVRCLSLDLAVQLGLLNPVQKKGKKF